MKTPIFFLTLFFAISACTTVSGSGDASGVNTDERKEIVGLEEMSLEYIQTLWGTPDGNVPAGAGRTVRFKNIRAEEEDPISETILVKMCDVRLDINKQELVQSWTYEKCEVQTKK